MILAHSALRAIGRSGSRHYRPTCTSSSSPHQRIACLAPLAAQKYRDPSFYAVRAFTTSASTGESKPEKRVAVLPASLNSLGLKYLERDALRAQFDRYDTNNDGTIDEQEAVQLLVDAGMDLSKAKEAAHGVVHSITTTTTSHTTSSNDSNSSNVSAAAAVVSWDDFKSAVDRAAEPVSNKIWPISASLLLNFSGQGVTWPILPILARSVGLGASELGIVTGASALARICSNVPAAALAERVGRKPLLVVGPAVGSFGYLGYAMGGDTFGALAAASAMTGVGGAMTSVGSGLFLSDISTPLNRARTMSPLMTTALLGFAMGPALGGFLAETYSLHTPFLVTATGMGLASLSALILLPETLRQPHKHMVKSTTEEEDKINASVPKMWRQLFGLQSIQGISAVALMSGVVQGAGPVTTILFATETLGMSPGELGIMFCVQILAMSVMIQPATALSDRYRGTTCRSVLILPGLAVSAIILAIQPFSTTMWEFAGLGALRAIADAMCVMPNVTPFIMDATTQEQRAQALAIRNMSQDVGILLGATSLGALSQFTTVPTAMFTAAGLQAVAAIFFFNRTQDSRLKKKQETRVD